MIHGSNAIPSSSAGTTAGRSSETSGGVAVTALAALASGKVGGRRNRSLSAGFGLAAAGGLTVVGAAGRLLIVGATASGRAAGGDGWAAGGRLAGLVTVPLRVKLDNSPGPISLEFDGGGAVAAPLLWATSGAAPSATADASNTALAKFTKRPKLDPSRAAYWPASPSASSGDSL